MTHLYIDAEWHTSGNIYLLGYAYSLKKFHYATWLDWNRLADIIAPVDGIVFCYGPDVGVLYRQTHLDIRRFRNVVNMLPTVRHLLPGLPDYKLATVEHYLGIKRTTPQYKTNHRDISRHFYNPAMHQQVISYNREDVHNLIRIKRKLNLSTDQWMRWAK